MKEAATNYNVYKNRYSFLMKNKSYLTSEGLEEIRVIKLGMNSLRSRS